MAWRAADPSGAIAETRRRAWPACPRVLGPRAPPPRRPQGPPAPQTRPRPDCPRGPQPVALGPADAPTCAPSDRAPRPRNEPAGGGGRGQWESAEDSRVLLGLLASGDVSRTTDTCQTDASHFRTHRRARLKLRLGHGFEMDISALLFLKTHKRDPSVRGRRELTRFLGGRDPCVGDGQRASVLGTRGGQRRCDSGATFTAKRLAALRTARATSPRPYCCVTGVLVRSLRLGPHGPSGASLEVSPEAFATLSAGPGQAHGDSGPGTVQGQRVPSPVAHWSLGR